MPRPNEHEIEESYERSGAGVPDEEDEALLRHIFEDDGPRQGLHQHGDKRTEE